MTHVSHLATRSIPRVYIGVSERLCELVSDAVDHRVRIVLAVRAARTAAASRAPGRVANEGYLDVRAAQVMAVVVAAVAVKEGAHSQGLNENAPWLAPAPSHALAAVAIQQHGLVREQEVQALRVLGQRATRDVVCNDGPDDWAVVRAAEVRGSRDRQLLLNRYKTVAD